MKRRDRRVGAPIAGKIKEGLGWVTGDRRAEAEGHVRHSKAERLGDDARVAPNDVDREEERVRRAHRDIT